MTIRCLLQVIRLQQPFRMHAAATCLFQISENRHKHSIVFHPATRYLFSTLVLLSLCIVSSPPLALSADRRAPPPLRPISDSNRPKRHLVAHAVSFSNKRALAARRSQRNYLRHSFNSTAIQHSAYLHTENNTATLVTSVQDMAHSSDGGVDGCATARQSNRPLVPPHQPSRPPSSAALSSPSMRG